jgi:hypothetical protein
VIELVRKSKSILIYYAVFGVGLALIAVYVWWVAEAGITDFAHLLLLADFVLFAASTLAISFSRRRAARIVLTLLSAAFGGIEGYLDLVMFPQPYGGLILFLWGAFGILLTLASLSWLVEISRPR